MRSGTTGHLPMAELVGEVRSWNPERDDPDGSFTYIDLSAVDQETKAVTGERELPCSEAPSRARQLVRAGDVLVSTVRPNLNGVAQVPAHLDGATASTGFCVLRPGEHLDSRFLYHWVRSPWFIADMVRKATGASYPAVSDRIVLESRIPSYPIDEQRRIVAVLDQADALRAKRRVALAQLDAIAQSIFLDMFGDPATNPMGWPEVPLGEHTTKIGSGATPAGGEPSYKTSGISLIRSMNVRDGYFSRQGLTFIDEHQAEKLNGVSVHEEDVLLNITGASVARVCRAPSDLLPARVNQHVAIIRPTESFCAVFLERCLLYPSFKRRLLRLAGAGATREAITKDAIEHLEVILPPPSRQKQFERAIRKLEALSDLKSEQAFALDSLFASLQARAFEGSL